jgi:hypothetical protein
MTCNTCGKDMIEGYWACTETDYRITDLDGNLKIKIEDHDIPSDDEEIGEKTSFHYCECGKYNN